MNIQQNKVIEITLVSSKVYSDPFNDVDVSVCVTDPNGIKCSISAFWAGNNTWKFRYSSEKIGTHTYVTSCCDLDNVDLNGCTDEIKIDCYDGENPLYKNGSVVRLNNDMYLSHKDGIPFFWLADTWWMGFTTRLDWPDGFKTLTKDRVEKGFNVVQIIAGLYPDMEPFDERGANKGGFPWDTEFKAINPAYFDAADIKIKHLVENGITPCIVGCWGFFMKFAGKEVIMRHWDYLLSRWGAYPVVLCMAGEANMTFYDDDSVPRDIHLKQSRSDWNDVTKHVRENNPFNRLVTIHPTSNGHEQIDDETLLDLDMLQTGHSSFMSIVPTMKNMTKAIERKKLPVIDSEVCYEGICGASGAEVQRYLFWMNVMLGACGHTYGANGIWQFSSRKKPYGVSPHGVSWGHTVWEDAYKLSGSYQLGAAKKFWTKFEWWKFEKHPEWIDNHCSGEATDGCFCVGIPEKVRIIFNPFLGGSGWNSDPINHIEKNVIYHAYRFDPITGEEIDLGIITPDENGTWITPRVKTFGDWVTALVAE